MQWLTSEQLKEQRSIELGYNPDSLKTFKVMDFNLGDAFGFFGMTGYGKSILAGNAAVELAKNRNLIILDYKGDYKNLKYVNMHNKNNRFNSIPDLVYVHRFGFKLQDFTSPFDWEMLGMTTNGANICAAKARMIPYHRNEMQKFIELIEQVTVFTKNNDKAEAWKATKQSILAKLNNLKSCFVGNDAIDITDLPAESIRYTGKPSYVSDWCKFVRKHKHICLNLNAEYNASKAQLLAGKILNEIEPVLKETSPVILGEEFHKICPSSMDKDHVPYSLIKILHYLKEKHKYGVKIIMISQYPGQINQEALDEVKRFFIGKLQNVKGDSKLDDMFRQSSSLRYNFLDDYREFLHCSPIYGEKDIFVPYDSLTFYTRRK